MTNWILLGLAIFFGLWLLITACGGKKPAKTIALSAGLGIVSLLLMAVVRHFGGPDIPINGYTLGIAATLGMPGVITLTFLGIFL